MPIPDLLVKHVDCLRNEGYEVTIIDGPEICIIIKNYLIPDKIWSQDKVELLVIAHPSYPNAKMDMFWVNPIITLKNKNPPQSTGLTSKCERNWQQFSWHVNSWNPATDNLITYLDVVNDRLRRAQ